MGPEHPSSWRTPEEPRALCWGAQLETAEGVALWVHCGQEGTGSSKLATSWYQKHSQLLSPAPHALTPPLQRAQNACARCYTATMPALPSHVAETGAGAGARPPPPMGQASLGGLRSSSGLAAPALG